MVKNEDDFIYEMLSYLGLIVLGTVGIMNSTGVLNLSGEVPLLRISGYLCLIMCCVMGLKFKNIEFGGIGIFWALTVVVIPKHIESIPLEPRPIQYIAIIAGSLTMLRLAKIVSTQIDKKDANL